MDLYKESKRAHCHARADAKCLHLVHDFCSVLASALCFWRPESSAQTTQKEAGGGPQPMGRCTGSWRCHGAGKVQFLDFQIFCF
jgi:hypothetical protein